MKDVVLCSAIKNGGESEWNLAWNQFKNSKVATEKDLLLSALACTKNKRVLQRSILFFISFLIMFDTLDKTLV